MGNPAGERGGGAVAAASPCCRALLAIVIAFHVPVRAAELPPTDAFAPGAAAAWATISWTVRSTITTGSSETA